MRSHIDNPQLRQLVNNSQVVLGDITSFFLALGSSAGYSWATASEEQSFLRRKGKVKVQTQEDNDAMKARFIGQKIKAARQQRGWTQEDVARRSGIARANIARLEAGRHMPEIATLNRLAGALVLDITELLKGPAFTPAQEDSDWIESGLAEWSSELDKEDRQT